MSIAGYKLFPVTRIPCFHERFNFEYFPGSSLDIQFQDAPAKSCPTQILLCSYGTWNKQWKNKKVNIKTGQCKILNWKSGTLKKQNVKIKTGQWKILNCKPGTLNMKSGTWNKQNVNIKTGNGKIFNIEPTIETWNLIHKI